MRRSAFGIFAVVSLLTAFGIAACSSSGDPAPGADSGTPAEGGTDPDGATTDGSTPDGATDSAVTDGSNDGSDGAVDEDAGPPAVQFIGRFDYADPTMPQTAWPGGRIVARFNGTGVTVRLEQTFDGFSGGPSWFNVIVDGVVKAPFAVPIGAPVDHVAAVGLPLGDHTVEIEKRTEANHGTVKFEGFTFEGGTGLLPPPLRLKRRIEWISESTIDGFGVEGDHNVTCIGTAPPEFDNARKSLAFYTSNTLLAEPHIIAYSGKGISVNNFAPDLDTMPIIFLRALPTMMGGGGTAWDFTRWTPDVIVMSIGGVDHEQGLSNVPADFKTKFGQFIADIRTKYGAAPHIFLTVWSQFKYNGGDFNYRTNLTADLDAIVATRQGVGDNKVYRYVFPVANAADETGCYDHANDAHHQAMAALLVTQIKAKTGW
jgi:hypothetical protein